MTNNTVNADAAARIIEQVFDGLFETKAEALEALARAVELEEQAETAALLNFFSGDEESTTPASVADAEADADANWADAYEVTDEQLSKLVARPNDDDVAGQEDDEPDDLPRGFLTEAEIALLSGEGADTAVSDWEAELDPANFSEGPVDPITDEMGRWEYDDRPHR